MRRILAATVLALMLPACAGAVQIGMTADEDGENRLVVFSSVPDGTDTAPEKKTQEEPDDVMQAIDWMIEARFAQKRAVLAAGRGTVVQTGSVWQTEKTASMALLWKGEQADGSDGCTGLGLNVNLQTGEEIALSQLFADWDGALAAMEAIIADDVLDGMRD